MTKYLKFIDKQYLKFIDKPRSENYNKKSVFRREPFLNLKKRRMFYMRVFFPIAYIDPGTGSMLFTILIGVLSAAFYFLRDSVMKVRFLFSGGKAEKQTGDRVPFVIFTDSKRYWNVFKPICDELEKRGQTTRYLTASEDDPALDSGYSHIQAEFIGDGNQAFARMNMLKADVVLSTTPGLDVYQWKRSRDVGCYVHIAHASSDLTLYRMFGLDYYDAVMTSGEYQVEQLRKLEALRGLPAKELPLIGLPYMDVMRTRLLEAEELPAHPTTVLLAPSWGPSSILNRFGAEMISSLLDTGCHIIVRPHPQSFRSELPMLEKIMEAFPASEQLEWDRSNDNFEVLRRSDIMISDFSGVIFDFALVFDKPVIYADTSFDKGPYDAWWLEDELWTFSVLPRIGRQLTRENFGHLADMIEECRDSEELRQGREQARAETWVNIGSGAVKAVDYLIAAREKLLSSDTPAAETADAQTAAAEA